MSACFKIKGKEVYIDEEDLSLTMQYTWWINKSGYVYCNTHRLFLHNLIMGINKHSFNKEIDHINRNKLDNRKNNLRFVDRQINNFNTGNQKNNKSCGIKGVSWHKQRKKWRAYIMFNYKQISLGLYNTLEEAISARLQYETELLDTLITNYRRNTK